MDRRLARERAEKEFNERSIELPSLTAGLNRICKKVVKEGLTEGAETELADDIRLAADHFGISSNAAVLLAYIAERSSDGGCTTEDLATYVGCSNLVFSGFQNDLEDMENKGIVMRNSGRRVSYIASRDAMKSIRTGQTYEPLPWKGISAEDLFTRFRMFFSDFRNDFIDADRLLDNILTLIENNPDLRFCRKVKESPLLRECGANGQRFFFYLCHRRVSYGNAFVPVDILLNMTDFMDDCQRIRRTIANGEMDIQHLGLVTFGGTNGFQDKDSLALTDEVVKEFLCEVKLLPEQAQGHQDLIPCSAIKEKSLFYNAEEASQMERLAGLLSEENYAGVRSRLEEKGMRKGFAVLFSGGAGCGKTAGAYELARRTGRDVFAVDMSQLKSKWVGDSEKSVKGVFSIYAEMCRTREKAPILLFNEADAIFSKRIENPRDSVDQMMNSIQNICLEAMENLDGILIATTNLAGNFCDEAFARRFIFKVDFTTPDAATRAKIWKSMIPELEDSDAEALGEKFVLSGGNIENVTRKAAVGYVLSGEKPSLAELEKYCGEESVLSRSKRIGF